MKKSNLFVVITCALVAFASCSNPSGSGSGGSTVGNDVTSLASKEDLIAKLPQAQPAVQDNFAGNTYEAQMSEDGATGTDTFIFGNDGTLQNVQVIKMGGAEMSFTMHAYYNVTSNTNSNNLFINMVPYKITYSFKGVPKEMIDAQVNGFEQMIADADVMNRACSIQSGNLVFSDSSNTIYTKKN